MLSTASAHEQLFLSSLPLVERVAAAVARRHVLDAAEAEEFGAWLKAKLIDDDYAVFRKFAGRSAIGTYLTVVVANLFRDYRNSRWGRWRPSAAAKRLGPVAVRLESLLYRDGLSQREAVSILRSAAPALTERDLLRMVATIPARYAVHEVGMDAAVVDDRVTVAPPSDAEVDASAARLDEVIARLLEELAPEDSLILRMRYWNDLTVADIARTLGLDQKGLYRRLDTLQARLRRALEARGVDRARAVEVLAEDAGD